MSNYSESRLRRHAHREGLQLRKFRESCRDYYQYGPYALADGSTNALVCWGLDLADVEKALNE